VVVVFCGSYRPWHGVHVLEEAARLQRRRQDLFFLLVGGRAPGDGHGYRGRSLGSVPYERMPEILATADIGCAPYDTTRLGQLRLGFYWSPLKIFEYMASGLAVVTIPRFPLTEIAREGQEALHAREGDAAHLAAVIERLADDALLREALGRRARERVLERYSWAQHCRQLEEILARIAS
jgi:glycosyltransferase involved in cell wall biosynthesis